MLELMTYFYVSCDRLAPMHTPRSPVAPKPRLSGAETGEASVLAELRRRKQQDKQQHVGMDGCRIIAVTDADWAQEVTQGWHVCGLCARCDHHTHLRRFCPGQGSPWALEFLAHLLRETRALGAPVLLVTDCTLLSQVAAGIIEVASDGTAWWALLSLDAGVNAPAAASTARALLASSSRMRPGAAYSLARACISLADELTHPGAIVRQLAVHRECAERSEGTLVVNGDNWRHAHAHGLYPSAASLAALEEVICQQDGGGKSNQVVVVPGGIASAFELVCTAFSLTGGTAILLGPAYYGIERAMAGRAITPQLLDLGGGEPGQVVATVRKHLAASTRMVVLTHPSLYVCECMADVLVELAGGLPPYCLLVVDECYRAYIPDSERCSIEHLSLTPTSPTIVGLRGLSKAHGLAALRLAYAVSDKRTSRRLRAASGHKTCAEPVLREAVRHLSERPLAVAVQADVRKRDSIVRSLHKQQIVARGAGPYVLVPSRTAEHFAQKARQLESAGIRVSLETCPIIVYQPATDVWDARFCEAVVAAVKH